jgi:oligopeptide/dipeptide ABC transporter ATP-binding protein
METATWPVARSYSKTARNVLSIFDIIMQQSESDNSTILEVTELKKYFPVLRGFFQRTAGYVRAVENISFSIERGRTLGLVGESGCGKTTVARMVLRLLNADEGKILFNGRDITDLAEKEMKPLRKKIQIIFQDPYGSLNPRMTAGQTIADGLAVAGIRGRTEQRKRLEQLFKMVGMSPAGIDRYPHEFSGGQRQRIGIARALSVDPSLIICDEPVSALDVSIQAQILNLLKDLQKQLNLSYLFISHDLNVVGYLCDRVAVMYRGRIMEYAPADALFDNPHHPYTHLLLSSIPDSEHPDTIAADQFEEGMEDMPPSASGCSFADRCPQKEEYCTQTDVSFEQVGQDHFVRCCRLRNTG